MVIQRRSSVRASASLGAVAIALLAALVMAPPGSAADGGASNVVRASGQLSDLMPATANPTDGASARVLAVQTPTSTIVVFVVHGLARSVAGESYGAHVHSGPCVPGNPAAAGPHYNVSGTTPPIVNQDTEVWLDFTVSRAGTGFAVTTVPFQIPPGDASSVVIHQEPTDPSTGAAGSRLACLPVPF